MKIFINGQPYDYAQPVDKNLTQALALLLDENPVQRAFAVALNGQFVGKADYSNTPVNAGDRIDLLFPIQGG